MSGGCGSPPPQEGIGGDGEYPDSQIRASRAVGGSPLGGQSLAMSHREGWTAAGVFLLQIQRRCHSSGAVQGSAEWPLACFHTVPLKTRKPKICLNQGEGRGHCIWWEQGGAVPTDLSTNTWGSCCVVPLSCRQRAFLWAGQSTQRGCSEDTGYSKWDLLPLFSVTCAPALCGQEALREAFSSHTASFPGQATTGHRSCLDFMPHLCFPSLIEN